MGLISDLFKPPDALIRKRVPEVHHAAYDIVSSAAFARLEPLGLSSRKKHMAVAFVMSVWVWNQAQCGVLQSQLEEDVLEEVRSRGLLAHQFMEEDGHVATSLLEEFMQAGLVPAVSADA